MSGGGKARLSFLIPLVGFLVLAGFATLALVATLSGERDVSQLPHVFRYICCHKLIRFNLYNLRLLFANFFWLFN